MENANFELSLLEPEEREQIEYIYNLIPEQDRVGINRQDILYVLDLMDDFLEEEGLLEVDEKTGEMTYKDGDVDDTRQLEFLMNAVRKSSSAPQPLCSPLTSSQIQMIMDGELQYGISQGWYEEE